MSSPQYTQGSEDGEVRQRTAPRFAVRSRPGPSRSPITPRRFNTSGAGSARATSNRDAVRDSLEQSSASSSSTPGYMPGVPAFPGYQSTSVRQAGAPAMRPPPPANMVTASQEQRGISHGANRLLQVVPDSSEEISVRQPSRRRPARVNTDSIIERFQLEVDQLDAKRDEEDPDYAPSDADTGTQDINTNDDAVEPEDSGILQSVEASGTDVRSETMERVDLPEVIEARESTLLEGTVEGIEMEDNNHAATIADDLAYREPLINQIKSNWSSDQLWPTELTPTGMQGQRLRPEEVSEEMLLAIERLSQKTKGNVEMAHAAIRRAYRRRVGLLGEVSRLLPEDIRAALEQITSSSKRASPKRARVREERDEEVVVIAGPSTKRSRRSVSQQEERRPVLQPSASTSLRGQGSVNVPQSPVTDIQMIVDEAQASDSSTESDTQSLNNHPMQGLSPTVSRATVPLQPSASFPVSPATIRSAGPSRNGLFKCTTVAAEPGAWNEVADELRATYELAADRAKAAGLDFVYAYFSLVPLELTR